MKIKGIKRNIVQAGEKVFTAGPITFSQYKMIRVE